ncbi:MAG TPA: 2,3-bisphosphoglycerate-independent phosphoglycerate mutase [Lachnospiraceae bacterium]|nr:2,3-bisphosphoglycerate-independent phosphoglycerate mutase [Lachnospiraceae bacterium]
MSPLKSPTILIIVNGIGIQKDKKVDIFNITDTPVFDTMKKECPYVLGLSSGMAVGLPNGQAGDSEVGCMNIGAGRIVYQELTRISKNIQFGLFEKNEVLKKTIDFCRQRDSCLHIIGLVSDGGVHSHLSHLYALLEFARKNYINKVYIHCILDGRDTDESSALFYLESLQNRMREIGVGEIATVMGRAYAMDRSRNYDRIKLAYYAMVNGEGNKASNAEDAVVAAYLRGETDEYIVPTVIVNGGVPVGTINDDDSVIFFNFRADRAKELTRAFCASEFRMFKRDVRPEVFFTCFSRYDEEPENVSIAFEPDFIENNLIDWLDKNGLKCALITEAEGASHLTRAFAGNTWESYDNVDTVIVDSPKIPFFDQKPEMSTSEVTDELIKAIQSGRYDFIAANYVNLDIMGHIADEAALKAALSAVDKNLFRVMKAIEETDSVLFLCSDHGNAEKITTGNNEKFKAHTTNPVPFFLVNYDEDYVLREGGCLSDVAPTILDIMGIEKPREMTGRTLLLKAI